MPGSGVEEGGIFWDLKQYVNALRRELDLWNHVMVKTKLGILKSKIKKAGEFFSYYSPRILNVIVE